MPTRKSTRSHATRAALLLGALSLATFGTTVYGRSGASPPGVSGGDQGVSLSSVAGTAKLSPHTAVAASSSSDEWQLIRIRYFAEDLQNASRYCTAAGETRLDYWNEPTVCTANDVLTDGKKNTLLNYALPRAVEMHAKRLKVQPASGNSNLVVSPETLKGYCNGFTLPFRYKWIAPFGTVAFPPPGSYFRCVITSPIYSIAFIQFL